uniref:Uncharacterized protein n=1 Tax=Caenorhabditis japonica TaxID=281687 RepID=A0A8R1EMC8_CAEJA
MRVLINRESAGLSTGNSLGISYEIAPRERFPALAYCSECELQERGLATQVYAQVYGHATARTTRDFGPRALASSLLSALLVSLGAPHSVSVSLRSWLRRGSTIILDTVTSLGSGYADLCKISFVSSQVPCGDRRSLWALYSSRVSPFGVTLVGVPVSCRLSLAATSAISTTDIDRIEGPWCTWIRWPGSLVGSLGWRIRGTLFPLVLDPRAHGFVGLARSLARLAGGFVARCPRWFWIRRDVVGRADVPRRAPCDWQDSCSCFWMDSCRASSSLVEDFCPVAELITSESMSCPVLVRPVRITPLHIAL